MLQVETVLALHLALFGSSLAFVGSALALVGSALALVRDALALVRETLALVRETLALVRDPLALFEARLMFVHVSGGLLAPRGKPLALLRQTLTLSRQPLPLLGNAPGSRVRQDIERGVYLLAWSHPAFMPEAVKVFLRHRPSVSTSRLHRAIGERCAGRRAEKA